MRVGVKKDNLRTEQGIEVFSDWSREKRVSYLNRILDKQFELYSWCETKVATLTTMDSILIGASLIFIDGMIENNAEKTLQYLIISLVVLVPFLISLTIALWHIRPKMGTVSNNGRPNHRTSNGIRHSKDSNAYRKMLDELTDDELFEDLTRQIYGMNQNIWKNQKSIKCAVAFDMVGLLAFLAMIIYLSI